MNEALAKRHIPVFVNQLRKATNEGIKTNLLAILADLCVEYSGCMVDTPPIPPLPSFAPGHTGLGHSGGVTPQILVPGSNHATTFNVISAGKGGQTLLAVWEFPRDWKIESGRLIPGRLFPGRRAAVLPVVAPGDRTPPPGSPSHPQDKYVPVLSWFMGDRSVLVRHTALVLLTRPGPHRPLPHPLPPPPPDVSGHKVVLSRGLPPPLTSFFIFHGAISVSVPISFRHCVEHSSGGGDPWMGMGISPPPPGTPLGGPGAAPGGGVHQVEGLPLLLLPRRRRRRRWRPCLATVQPCLAPSRVTSVARRRASIPPHFLHGKKPIAPPHLGGATTR